MKLDFDVSAKEYALLRDILEAYLPKGVKVWVFGSRAKNTARFNSDLDLALESTEALPKDVIPRLKDAFTEAPIAYRVDLVDMAEVSESFTEIIRAQAVPFPIEPQRNVPKLRFPGFEGEWGEQEFSSFLTPDFRDVPKPDESYLALGVRSHGKGTFQKPGSDPEKIAMDTLYEVHANDLIVNITFAWEGAIAIARSEDNGGLVSHRFPTYTFDRSKVIHEFFEYIIEDRRLRHTLDLISPGGAGRNRVLSKKAFVQIRHQFPTLPEQRKIAGFVGAVDLRIAQLAEKKRLLEDYKKGCMQQLFSQKLRFKDDQGNDFPDWEEKLFGEVVSRSKDKFDPRKDTDTPQLIELENIESKTGKIVGVSSLEGQKSLKSKFRHGDVLFSKLRPYLRKFAMPDFDGVCTSEIWVLQSHELDGVFLFYLVQSEQFMQLANLSAGSKMPRAEWSVIADSEFGIPHPDEQRKIADFLSALDTKIDLVGQELTHARSFKRGLLQQMFV